MITSMPAIPVRRERNKKEGSIGYFSRPHKLSLHFRPPLSHHQVTPTPSPINSPQGVTETQQHQESGAHGLARLLAEKRVFFQLSVLLPLAGALLLFIGLIQLVPGAEGKHYGMFLIVLGTIFLVLGLLLIIIRLFCKWQLERHEMSYLHGGVLPEIKVNEPSLNDVDLEKNGNGGGGSELMESSYSQQHRRSSQTQQQSSSSNYNDRTNTAATEQVQVNTSGKSSNGGGGGNGSTAPTPNIYYNPLKYCKPHP